MRYRTLGLLPLLVVAGCASTPTRFWTIEPVSATARVPTNPSPANPIIPIQIAAVHVPLAIDRLELVQHDGENRVKVLDFDRWSAPPGDLLRRALTQDLAGLLPPGSVIYPDAPAPEGTRHIAIDILDLRQVGDTFTMQLSWSVVDKPERSHQLRLRVPAADGGVAAQTQAMAEITGQLARDVATEITR